LILKATYTTSTYSVQRSEGPVNIFDSIFAGDCDIFVAKMSFMATYNKLKTSPK
jgi:hypothetical protein